MAQPSFRGLSVVSDPSKMGSQDGLFEKVRLPKNADGSNNRDFTYFMVGNTRMIYASVARLGVIKV